MPPKKIGNKYEIAGDIAIGYTTNGGIYLLDVEDLDVAKEYTWWSDPEGYISTRVYSKGSRVGYTEKLHRLIMGLKHNDGGIVDHVNREKHDNRRSNIRIVDYRTNAINRSLSTRNKSGVMGIFYRQKQRSPWVSTIWIDGKQYQKSFKTKEEAIEHRKDQERVAYGDCRYTV